MNPTVSQDLCRTEGSDHDQGVEKEKSGKAQQGRGGIPVYRKNPPARKILQGWYCQPDRIWNHLGDTPPSIALRDELVPGHTCEAAS